MHKLTLNTVVYAVNFFIIASSLHTKGEGTYNVVKTNAQSHFMEKWNRICLNQNFFYSRGLYFRINSQKYRDAKIKCEPIISNERSIEKK